MFENFDDATKASTNASNKEISEKLKFKVSKEEEIKLRNKFSSQIKKFYADLEGVSDNLSSLDDEDEDISCSSHSASASDSDADVDIDK